MNVVQSLGLRKSENSRNNASISLKSDPTTRFGKKSNFKEMLTRNFFRKFPITGEISDIQQLQIERTVTNDMEKFV